MNGKVLMLAIIFLGGFHVFYAFNRVQNFANIMYRLCAIQLGECHTAVFFYKKAEGQHELDKALEGVSYHKKSTMAFIQAI